MTDLAIAKGKTFRRILRWEAPPIVYKAITGITQTAPIRITCPQHEVPEGWRVAIVSVKGMTQINAENDPPKAKDYLAATVKDANTIELNEINAAGFRAYISGGYVQYNTPVPLSGYTARMSVKDKVGGTELFRLDTLNGRINIDANAHTITLSISATDTEAMSFKKGVYDLELVSADGVVTVLLAGTVVVGAEVTTT